MPQPQAEHNADYPMTLDLRRTPAVGELAE
jgi:hypothetical protein